MSLKLWPYLQPFVTYLASKSGVTLKTGLVFVQGHWTWHHLIDLIVIQVPIHQSIHHLFKQNEQTMSYKQSESI